MYKTLEKVQNQKLSQNQTVTSRVKYGKYEPIQTVAVGSNPATVYGVPVFNSIGIREMNAMDGMKGIKGIKEMDGKGDVGKVLNQVGLRLEANDVVVILGPRITTEAIYWSFVPYLISRSSKILLTSVNDSINNYDVGITVTHFAIVSGRNQVAINHVANILEKEGYTPYVLSFPDLIYSSDNVMVVGRTTFINNDKGRQNFLTNNNLQSRLYTIQDDIPYEPYVLGIDLIMKQRATSHPEYPKYGRQFIDFTDRIKPLNTSYEGELEDFLGGIYTGLGAIATNQNARLDTRDTCYKWLKDITLDPEKDFIVFCGVNHILTRKGQYISVSVYNQEKSATITGFQTSDSNYLFYAIVIGYSPLIDNVILPQFSGTNTSIKMVLPPYSIGNILTLVERCYIQLPENIGPSSSSILSPKVFIAHIHQIK